MTSIHPPAWARRLIVGTAGTALVAGLALGAAAPADAAPQVWDKVASCESSGNWKINTGNGYYGGLQFSLSTWRAFGGRTYAAYPNQATKAEQIAIAQRTLAAQGPGAWPTCGRRAGLTKSNGGASAKATAGSTAKKATAKKATAKKATAKKATTKKATPKKATPKKATSSKSITVRSGDTLAKLARKYKVSGGWKAVAKKNKLRNPNLIFVGQRILLP